MQITPTKSVGILYVRQLPTSTKKYQPHVRKYISAFTFLKIYSSHARTNLHIKIVGGDNVVSIVGRSVGPLAFIKCNQSRGLYLLTKSRKVNAGLVDVSRGGLLPTHPPPPRGRRGWVRTIGGVFKLGKRSVCKSPNRIWRYNTGAGCVRHAYYYTPTPRDGVIFDAMWKIGCDNGRSSNYNEIQIYPLLPSSLGDVERRGNDPEPRKSLNREVEIRLY